MKGSRRAVYVSDGNEKKGAGTEISFHADQHSQSGVDVLELRAMEGGRRTVYVNNEDEKEGVRRGAFFYADQYG
jgi:hypothetical protein